MGRKTKETGIENAALQKNIEETIEDNPRILLLN